MSFTATSDRLRFDRQSLERLDNPERSVQEKADSYMDHSREQVFEISFFTKKRLRGCQAFL
jgi:hypothetical protein